MKERGMYGPYMIYRCSRCGDEVTTSASYAGVICQRILQGPSFDKNGKMKIKICGGKYKYVRTVGK